MKHLVLIMAISSIILIGIKASPQPRELGEGTIDLEGSVRAPEFPQDAQWLNTEHPLYIKGLKGKVVLLDFWTYCCINCIHIMPDLKKLEENYKNELVVIGVHSAKFDNEKDTDNIRQAILRYDLRHAVINDNDFAIWRSYTVNAWPTLVLIAPNGKIVGTLTGEGVYQTLDKAIAKVIRHFDAASAGADALDRSPLRLSLEKDKTPQTLLSFPGKIAADEETKRLFISDSGHNRIIISSLDGNIQTVIGGTQGFRDGDFNTAKFFHPQGLCYDPDMDLLYVADTENHAIRKIDFKTKKVSTLAGSGKQTSSFASKEGRGVELNSPWDLVLVKNLLYVAMAGSHQLWTIDVKTGEAKVFAGSSQEDIIDGPLKQAALAQPSGITTYGTKLYFADSEVSAVREAALPGQDNPRVKTLIGKGLFEFGDIDGTYPKARLQHPVGVAYHDGFVYVADTYNHKIKKLNLQTTELVTVVGTGKPGMADGKASTAALREPYGLAFAGNTMFIADTNNHLIRVYDIKTDMVSTLIFKEMEKLMQKSATPDIFQGKQNTLPQQKVAAGEGSLGLSIKLPKGTHFTPRAPFSLKVSSTNPEVILLGLDKVKTPAPKISIPFKAKAGQTTIALNMLIYYCNNGVEGMCFFKEASLSVPVKISDAEGGTGKTINVSYEVK